MSEARTPLPRVKVVGKQHPHRGEYGRFTGRVVSLFGKKMASVATFHRAIFGRLTMTTNSSGEVRTPLEALIAEWRDIAALSSIRVVAQTYRQCADRLEAALAAVPPAEPAAEERYGDMRCAACGHLSSEHACDHAASDMGCDKCDCEAYAMRRAAEPAPTTTGPELQDSSLLDLILKKTREAFGTQGETYLRDALRSTAIQPAEPAPAPAPALHRCSGCGLHWGDPSNYHFETVTMNRDE